MEKNSEVLTLEQVKELLKDVLSDDASSSDMVLSNAGEKGDGFMSFMAKVDVGSNHFLIKWAPRTASFRELTGTRANFVREIYFYDTVFPAFRKFQEERNVSNPFMNVPNCYKTCTQEFKELLVMDNLAKHGFTMWDKKIPMDDAHVSMILEEYGKLHAISFAMKDQDKKLYESLEENLLTRFEGTNINKTIGTTVLQAKERLLAAVSPDSDGGLYKSLVAFRDDPDFKDLVLVPSPYGVIIHGDSWCNNFLFSHKDGLSTGAPTNVTFIDFQGTRICTPVSDISYFFYTAASKEKLDDHKTYLQKYYASFCRHLKALGSDPEKLFPMDVFMEEWKKYSKFGMILALLVFNVVLREEDEVMDVSDVGNKSVSLDDVFGSTGRNEDAVNRKLLDLARHLYENGYI